MNASDYEKIWDKALDRYGLEHQVDRAIEEMSELMKALLKLRRLDPSDFKKIDAATLDVLEEMADVFVTVGCLRYVFDNNDFVDNKMDEKISRAQVRIDNPGWTGG